MRTCVVVTTINVPEVILGYAENALRYGHDDVGFLVVGDKKTPDEPAQDVVDRVKVSGLRAEYWDIELQEKWLKPFPRFNEIIPYNSDNRRNIGFLAALEKGAEVVVSIDDDNYAIADEDFFGAHAIVGQEVTLTSVHASNGWFNPCGLLEFEPNIAVYSRGYPFGKRWNDKVTFGRASGRVAVSMGLWTGDPDVDAVTRLAGPVRSLGLKARQPSFLLENCYMPINSQNTAVHRDAMPAFYFVLQGAKIDGLIMDRYGDIWAGFFLNKVVAHIGDRIAVGSPLVKHVRNRHDLLRDLQNELWGMVITEYLASHIDGVPLASRTYAGSYAELAESIKGIDLYPHAAVHAYLMDLSEAMQIWLEVCRQVANAGGDVSYRA